MRTIQVRRRIDSETLTLPELRPFIGREVRITIVDETGLPDELIRASNEFWNPPSLEKLARRQGVRPVQPGDPSGSLSAEDFEGFDELLAASRKQATRVDAEGPG